MLNVMYLCSSWRDVAELLILPISESTQGKTTSS